MTVFGGLGRALATPRTLEGRNIRNLSVDTAIQGVIGAGITTFLSIFLVRLGASNVTVGLLTSLPALLTVFLSIPLGALIEGRPNPVRMVVGTRFPVYLTFLLIAGVSFFASGETAALIVVTLWTLTAIPSAVLNTVWMTVVAEIVPPDKRPRVNGNRWALLSVVTAVCVAAFGGLLDVTPFPINYQVVFAISFVAGLFSMYQFSRIKEPRAIPARKPTGRGIRAQIDDILGALRQEREFTRFLATAQVFRFGLNLPVAVMPIFWVEQLRASDTTIGLRTTAANAALVVGYYLWGRVAARFGHRSVLVIASFGMSLYPLATAAVTSAEWLVPAALVWGAFVSGIDIAFFEVLLRTCPPERRSVFVSMNGASANLAIFAGPLIGTLLLDYLDARAVLALAGLLSLAGAALFARFAVGAAPRPARLRA